MSKKPKPPLPPPMFVSVEEFANALQVHRSTVYRWIDARTLKAVKIAGTRRIPAGELQRLTGAV